LGAMLLRFRQLLAVEAVAAAQAVDLAAPASLGRGAALLHRAVRGVVAGLDDDRPCGVDVERVSEDVLGSAEVRRGIRELLG